MRDPVEEMLEKLDAKRDYQGMATVRALSAIIFLIREKDQPIDLKFDVLRYVLECHASGSQYALLQKLDEGTKKFPGMPMGAAITVWSHLLAKREEEAMEKLAVLLGAFKEFDGEDLQAELRKSKERAAARELARK